MHLCRPNRETPGVNSCGRLLSCMVRPSHKPSKSTEELLIGCDNERANTEMKPPNMHAHAWTAREHLDSCCVVGTRSLVVGSWLCAAGLTQRTHGRAQAQHIGRRWGSSLYHRGACFLSMQSPMSGLKIASRQGRSRLARQVRLLIPYIQDTSCSI